MCPTKKPDGEPDKKKAVTISPWFGKNGWSHSSGCGMHWCSAFCSACAGYADRKVSGGDSTYQKTSLARFLANSKPESKYSTNIKDIRPGLVIIYSRSGGGHIHMCVAVSAPGFTTIGGNESKKGGHSGGSGAVVKTTWTWESWQAKRAKAFIGIYKMWPESNESIKNSNLGSISPIDTNAASYSDTVSAETAQSSDGAPPGSSDFNIKGEQADDTGYQSLDLNAIWSNSTVPINSTASNTSNAKKSLDTPEIITVLNPNKAELAGEGKRDKQIINMDKK